MQCDRAQEQFSDYIEGAMDPAMRQVFEQHLDVCPSCRKDVEQLKSVYALLDDGLPLVDVPPGFRAAILNTIREQPVHDSFLSHLRSWLIPGEAGGTRRAPAIVITAAALLVVFGGHAWLKQHSPRHTHGPIDSAGLIPWAFGTVHVQNANGILQGVKSYQSKDGNTYHVFSLHLPSGEASVNATAYVIQSPEAFSSDQALQSDANATKIWSGTVDPGVGVQVPVAVVSNVAPGTSMTFLAEWSDAQGPHEEVCILPISATPVLPMVVSAGESLYQSLQTVAVAFQHPVLLNNSAVGDLTQPISEGLDSSDTTINDSLADLVLRDNLTFNSQPDGSYLIDGS